MEHTLNTSIPREKGSQSSDSCRHSWSADFMDGQIYTEALRQNPKQSNHCNNKRKNDIIVNVVTLVFLRPLKETYLTELCKVPLDRCYTWNMKVHFHRWDHCPISWGNKRVRKRMRTDYDPCLFSSPCLWTHADKLPYSSCFVILTVMNSIPLKCESRKTFYM